MTLLDARAGLSSPVIEVLVRDCICSTAKAETMFRGKNDKPKELVGIV